MSDSRAEEEIKREVHKSMVEDQRRREALARHYSQRRSDNDTYSPSETMWGK